LLRSPSAQATKPTPHQSRMIPPRLYRSGVENKPAQYSGCRPLLRTAATKGAGYEVTPRLSGFRSLPGRGMPQAVKARGLHTTSSAAPGKQPTESARM
jgi:hypothetical protein